MFIHFFVFCHSGTIHDDLHDGNTISLDKEAVQDHKKPGAPRAEFYAQFSIIDSGCIIESCCMFDLSALLGDITICIEIPPRDYKEHIKMFKWRMKNRTNHDDKCDRSANVINYESHPAADAEIVRLQDEADKTSGEVPKDQGSSNALGNLTKERTPNKDHLLLDPSTTATNHGHAIAGFLMTYFAHALLNFNTNTAP